MHAFSSDRRRCFERKEEYKDAYDNIWCEAYTRGRLAVRRLRSKSRSTSRQVSRRDLARVEDPGGRSRAGHRRAVCSTFGCSALEVMEARNSNNDRGTPPAQRTCHPLPTKWSRSVNKYSGTLAQLGQSVRRPVRQRLARQTILRFSNTPRSVAYSMRNDPERFFKKMPFTDPSSDHQGWHLDAVRSNLSAPLPIICLAATVMNVRLLAILLVALLLPLSMSAPSAMACSRTACCGPNCSSDAPVNQISCCKAPVAPDRATSQAPEAQHLDSIARIPLATVTFAIFLPQNIVGVRGYAPPNRLASLALLCSRQI